LIFPWIFRTSWPKERVFGVGQNGGTAGAMLTPNKLYFWGFLHLCQFWWKSIKKCYRESADRRIHRQTDGRKPIL